MAIDLKNILLKFSGPPDDVFGDYINHIANGGLTRYRRIVQWGNKEGQPLYAHVIDLVFTFARLAEPLGLTPTEQRVVMLALSAHDINKVLGGDRPVRFADQAQPAHVAPELERLGAEGFFPEWRLYIEDICALIRAHGGHYHHAGLLLDVRPSQDERFALGIERVEQLGKLMKAFDTLDLSHSLNEQQHKQSFISHLNTFSETQYHLVSHRVAEQRGILSNALHNRVAEFMQRKKGAQPLLYYPDGVVYLVEQGQVLAVTEEEYGQIAEKLAGFLEDQIRGKWRNFVKAGNQGIKVDDKCLELGVPFADIWQEVDNIIQGKNYAAVADMESKARKRAAESIGDGASPAAEVVRAKLADERLLPTTKAQLRLGELLRSYYIFLSKHFKKQVKDPWLRLYDLLAIDPTTQAIYNFFEINYDRAYVVAGDLTLSYDDLFQQIVTDGSHLLGDKVVESVWTPLFAEYVQQQVQFSFQTPPSHALVGHLQHYVQNNNRQSAFASSSFATELWRAGDVAKSIKVQQFSNRLLAGPGDPVKYVDPITKAQFLLEKLCYAPAFNATTYYLHIYPHAFFSDAYLRMWHDTVETLANTYLEDDKLNALFLKTDDTLRDLFAGAEQVQLTASAANSNGLPLPGAPELLGNLLIWPLNAPGDNDTECFWYAFTCAIAMHHFVGGRVVLTRSAAPILSAEEAEAFEIFTDEIPLSINALLRDNGYSYTTLPNLEKQLGALYNIYRGVRSDGDELLPLIRSLNDGALGIYFAAERFLLKRIKNDKKAKNPEWLTIQSAQTLANDLRAITTEQGGEKVNETIQRLAQLAWDGNLKGQTLAKNSLMMPLDHCFEKVQMMQPPVDKETLRAVTITDIYSYLERIRDDGMVGQETQRKAKAFVDAFFDELWGNHYANNRQRLLTDEKLIRSAFLFHIRELLAKRSAEKVNEAKANEGKVATQ
jgi:CRISPR-associated protein Csc3